MARDPKHDILFEPIQIGPKTMKNRFYQVPHCNGFGSEKPGSQAYFRAMKAEGGWAGGLHRVLLDLARSPTTRTASRRASGTTTTSGTCRSCATCSTSTARSPASSSGTAARTRRAWSRAASPRGPSQIASDFEFLTYCDRGGQGRHPARPEALRRGREAGPQAGFDIVYVYGAHSYLPQQFLSPFYNQRTDEYGGSFENRARFWLETLEQVKEAVGDDCAIARPHVDRHVHRRGRNAARARRPRRSSSSCDHLVDLWDVNVSGIAEWGEDAAPSRFFAAGLRSSRGRPRSRRPRRADRRRRPLDEPGRDGGRDQRRRAGTSSAPAGPSIADPFLPKKIEEGRLDDIRECIGCNVCISRWEIGGPPLICTQNATAGEEYRRGWHPERFRAGGERRQRRARRRRGPAGMECAIVLGKRGMRRVHLVEAPGRHRRHHALDPAAARASASGAASSTGARSSSTS